MYPKKGPSSEVASLSFGSTAGTESWHLTLHWAGTVVCPTDGRVASRTWPLPLEAQRVSFVPSAVEISEAESDRNEKLIYWISKNWISWQS